MRFLYSYLVVVLLILSLSTSSTSSHLVEVDVNVDIERDPSNGHDGEGLSALSSSPPHRTEQKDSSPIVDESDPFGILHHEDTHIPMVFKDFGDCSGTIDGQSFNGHCVDLSGCQYGTPIEGFCKDGGATVQCCVSEADGMRVLPKGPEEWKMKFEMWAASHRIHYADDKEKEKRMNIFKRHATYIHSSNGDTTKTFKLALNDRADMEIHEVFPIKVKEGWKGRRSLHGGGGNPRRHRVNGPPCTLKQSVGSGVCVSQDECSSMGGEAMEDCGRGLQCCLTEKNFLYAKDHPICPDMGTLDIDWRSHPGVLTSIKNQGSCGSCYVHSAAETLESRYAILTGQPAVPLSVQQFLSCNTESAGCKGGMAQDVLNFFAQNGACAEAEFPYFSGDFPSAGVAVTAPLHSHVHINNVAALCKSCKRVIQPWYNASLHLGISHYSEKASSLSSKEEALAKGPISADIMADADVMFYSSGIINKGSVITADSGGHSIEIVGMGEQNGESYWLLRNSWGPQWGECGHFRVQKGFDVIEIESGHSWWPLFANDLSSLAAEYSTNVKCTTVKGTQGFCALQELCMVGGGFRGYSMTPSATSKCLPQQFCCLDQNAHNQDMSLPDVQ